jgi:hypothetical protein
MQLDVDLAGLASIEQAENGSLTRRCP